MGIKHLLLLLIYLDPLNVLSAAASTKKSRAPPRRNPKKEVNGSTTAVPLAVAVPGRITQVQATPVIQHDTCLGYYDVSGQYDKEFACNNTDHRFCCGSCFLRFCCADRGKRVEQKTCTNYNTPDWIKTQPPSPAPTGDTYDPALDQTNTTVYISCGVVALVIAIGISAKVAYDKATKTPQEMNVHRALADILKQQGPVPISQYDQEDMSAIDGSPKDDTPVRTSKNHYTPVHKQNHGHYGKENFRSGQDMHNFLSSGYVTLERGRLKAQHSVDDIGQMSWQGDLDLPISYSNHQHDYHHSHLDLTALTPKMAHRQMRYERPQRNNILTSATEPYDLSLSRSFQNLSHLPPSYELAMKPELSDKDVDEYYTRKHHHPDFGGRGPTHMVKLNAEPQQQHQQQHHQQHQQQHQQQHRQRPRRVQRAMSQDHVLSPPRTPRRGDYGLSSYGGMAATAYGSTHHLSEEQLLSADRLHSQDPLLSPVVRRNKFREKALMVRALSQADMLMPTTPSRTMDRHKMAKMHSHPSASNDSYNTLTVNHPAPTSKRQAFATRRTHTVDHLQYIPGPGHHHNQYRTASKNEVTV
ncbi:protein shisa-6 [Diretmus argenteus]